MLKNYLLKGFMVFAALFILLGIIPVGQNLVNADGFDTQVSEQSEVKTQVESIVSEKVDIQQNQDSTDLRESEESIDTYAEIGPTYPNTSVSMRIGDVLYSTKTLGGSSQIVGHVGIVNSNFKVVHVTPVVDGGVVDTFTTYMGRHGVGETIKVYRPRNGMGVEAAKWAVYNYSKVTDYFINPLGLLGTLNPNYCSKFIWQAFYYGEGVDIYNNGAGNPNKPGLVTPSIFTTSNQLTYTTQFKTQ
ncbi:hypothetical protein [Paenibacillus gallinarum]|uniref:Uncharacterized protein n=1 Tax=Paenibacillus gallinarum TaxID=2762232 RepID=A0ABR8T400_9BACL|nr:hypothetical protein [Paenibacillus gallinarum]MBD7970491.1 hypothetical protein [Paenibacillus gallinarum]